MMSMKDHVEKNPFIYLLGTVVASVSVTIGVDRYFQNKNIDSLTAEHNLETQRNKDVLAAITAEHNLATQRTKDRLAAITAEHNLEIEQYEERLAAIGRRIGTTNALDVSSFLLRRADGSQPPPSSHFFPDWSFYGPSDDQYWVHEESRIGELMWRQLNPDFHAFADMDLDEMAESVRTSPEYSGTLTAHLWIAENAPRVRLGPVQFFPYVTVTRTDLTDFLAEFDESADSYVVDPTDRAFIEMWRKMEDEFSSFSKSSGVTTIIENLQILSVQKYADVLHFRGLVTLKNAEVEGVIHPVYYVRTEWVFISTPDYIWRITTNTMSEDPAPRDESDAKLTEWFSQFAVRFD